MKKIILLSLVFPIVNSCAVQITNQTNYPVKVVVLYGCAHADGVLSTDNNSGIAKYSFDLENKGDSTDSIPMNITKSKAVCNLALKTIKATMYIPDPNNPNTTIEVTKIWQWPIDKISRNQNIISITSYRNLVMPELSLR